MESLELADILSSFIASSFGKFSLITSNCVISNFADTQVWYVFVELIMLCGMHCFVHCNDSTIGFCVLLVNFDNFSRSFNSEVGL